MFTPWRDRSCLRVWCRCASHRLPRSARPGPRGEGCVHRCGRRTDSPAFPSRLLTPRSPWLSRRFHPSVQSRRTRPGDACTGFRAGRRGRTPPATQETRAARSTRSRLRQRLDLRCPNARTPGRRIPTPARKAPLGLPLGLSGSASVVTQGGDLLCSGSRARRKPPQRLTGPSGVNYD